MFEKILVAAGIVFPLFSLVYLIGAYIRASMEAEMASALVSASPIERPLALQEYLDRKYISSQASLEMYVRWWVWDNFRTARRWFKEREHARRLQQQFY